MLSSTFSFFRRVLTRQEQRVPSFQAARSFPKILDPKPPSGGVPCPGSGGSWGRNQRHGESKSGFRPQQNFLVRAAVLILPAGVWGPPAHMSAISFLPEIESAQQSASPFHSPRMSELNTRLRPSRAMHSRRTLQIGARNRQSAIGNAQVCQKQSLHPIFRPISHDDSLGVAPPLQYMEERV